MHVHETDISSTPHLDCCSQEKDSEDAQNWFVGSVDIKTAFHQMRIPIQSWLHGENDLPDMFPIP